MIPKIKFRYSWIYNEGYKNSPRIQKTLKKQKKLYPSQKKISDYIKKIEPKWRKIEKDVLKEISKISRLQWKEKEIICYVIGFGKPFSDPMTIRLYDNKNDFIDTLIHEMIHRIQTQNQSVNDKWEKYIEKKYGKETRITRNHIALHAIHYKVYLRFFGKKRLERDINYSKKVKADDYTRSWRIVLEEGPENIIKKFNEVTK